MTFPLDFLLPLQEKPAPFTPGEAVFWDHPHISAQLLAAHLDPDVDRASRRPGTIDASVAWITAQAPGPAILDLGCGPGLYAQRLARRGFTVTGVDYSQRSIAYAAAQARAEGLPITYRRQDYLTLEDRGQYDLALLIFGDFCPLSPDRCSRLLANVRRALRPGGRFIFDVSTREHRRLHGAANAWYAAPGGFWRAGPHLVLEHGFDYPEQSIYLDQYLVIEPDAPPAVYRMWFQDYDLPAITAELQASGFEVLGAWSDLAGTPLSPGSEWIGLLTRPV